jgi:hypothetical protein
MHNIYSFSPGLTLGNAVIRSVCLRQPSSFGIFFFTVHHLNDIIIRLMSVLCSMMMDNVINKADR